MNHALDWLQFVLAPQMINGLSIGVAVVLMALGLTIIFGLLDVINMAHGEFYAIGAYLAVALLGLGLSFWWALVLTPLLMAALGYATERGLIQRVFHSKDRHTLTLLLTFGVPVPPKWWGCSFPTTGCSSWCSVACSLPRSGCWCSALRSVPWCGPPPTTGT
jgi:branched-chain amino acid transport system permease protein